MAKNRNSGGKFQKGNQAAKKPLKCPYCDKEIEVKGYYHLNKKNQNKPFKNGGGMRKNEDRGFKTTQKQES